MSVCVLNESLFTHTQISDYPITGGIGSTDFLGASGDIAFNRDNIPGVCRRCNQLLVNTEEKEIAKILK